MNGTPGGPARIVATAGLIALLTAGAVAAGIAAGNAIATRNDAVALTGIDIQKPGH